MSRKCILLQVAIAEFLYNCVADMVASISITDRRAKCAIGEEARGIEILC